MKFEKEVVEKVTISYQPEETREVLEYCSLGRYKIIFVHAIPDGRSKHYRGEMIIIAERLFDSCSQDNSGR